MNEKISMIIYIGIVITLMAGIPLGICYLFSLINDELALGMFLITLPLGLWIGPKVGGMFLAR